MKTGLVLDCATGTVLVWLGFGWIGLGWVGLGGFWLGCDLILVLVWFGLVVLGCVKLCLIGFDLVLVGLGLSLVGFGFGFGTELCLCTVKKRSTRCTGVTPEMRAFCMALLNVSWLRMALLDGLDHQV